MQVKSLVALISLGMAALSAGAQTSINLSNYSITGIYAIDTPGSIGLEASAVTYARDRGTLFYVGDEGPGVVEISRTGQTIGSMSFDWTGTGSTHNDAEGLTYIGNNQFVVLDERPQRAYQFSYSAGGTVVLASAPFATVSSYTPSNFGLEGISYDPRNGSFVTVKQDDSPGNPARGPQEVRSGALTFAVGGGSSSLPVLFDAYLLGVNSLSDVQTLSAVTALAGAPAADNLLILSLDSRKLVEAKRDGTILSSFDLAGVLPNNNVEGVTIDENGVIYLVAEQRQGAGAPAGAQSQLIVLTPVPEPESFAMLLAGLGIVGAMVRRRRSDAAACT